MRILAVSDEVSDLLYRPSFLDGIKPVEVLVSCGDLPYSYMEYLVTRVGTRHAFFVHGNHDHPEHLSNDRILSGPGGWQNVDRQIGTVGEDALVVAGLEGSMRYRPDGHYQYTESQMRSRAWKLQWKLHLRRFFHRRALDLFIAHAPARGIHDSQQGAHRGFEVFLTLIDRFEPRLFLHGHHHLYGTQSWHTQRGRTSIVNVHPYRILELEDNRIKIGDVVIDNATSGNVAVDV